MLIKQMKSDSLGRRTDRVKKREVDQMMRLHNQGMTEAEIALKLKRKPQTVKRHLEVALLPYEKGIFPKAQAERLKEAQQIEHISSLQRFAREILDSVDAVSYPADIHSWDDLEQTQNSLWRVFKRITSDARWPRLAAHLGDHVFDIYDMTKGLEPAKLKAAREKLGSIVYVRHSTDDVIGVIDEAYELISRSSLNLIAEEADTEEWERCGLERWCPWCPNPVSDK